MLRGKIAPAEKGRAVRNWKRPLALALGLLGLGAGAAVVLALRPPCLIREATGLYCGACGFTRMAEELLRGHFAAAFWQNPYLFCLLPLLAAWLAGEALCWLRARPPLWRRRWFLWGLAAVAALGMGFTVLRNLPGFGCLRPG